MPMRTATVLLLSCFCGLANDLTPVEIIRRACDREASNESIYRQYAFRQDLWQRVNKKEERRVHEVMYIAGQQYRRLVEKDGKPLSAEEAADEQERLDKELDKARRESPDRAQKRAIKEQREADEFRDQISQAFDFKLIGEEMVSGRLCYRIHGDPKPGFKAKGEAKFLAKMRGDVWIDKSDFHWAKVDLETVDTITGMVGLVRLARGSTIAVRRSYVNQEVWAPELVEVKAAARALLFISAALDVRLRFSDFKKFSVDSKVTVVGE